jgi:mRNA guanylyltransferase
VRVCVVGCGFTDAPGSYFLCEKTDGIRLLLYITVGDAGEEIVYLIDRKNDYYFIPNGGTSIHTARPLITTHHV